MISPDNVAGTFLSRLFERRPVFVEEVRLSETVPAPHPLEAEQVANAITKRRIEFAAGRHCARRALARLNVENFVLRNGRDRAPVWPAGVLGAITHTGDFARGGYCGVVVGRADQIVAVGIDIEQAKPLELPLWSRVLTATEQRSLRAADPVMAGMVAKTIFSAKECFYKAQFPLSRQFLRFQDVEIELHPGHSTFEACLTTEAPRGLPLTRCAGRFLGSDEFVATGIALLA